MKRNWIAALAALTLVVALSGCNGTGGVNEPAGSPAASDSTGMNGDKDVGGGLPNNAGGTVNNGGTTNNGGTVNNGMGTTNNGAGTTNNDVGTANNGGTTNGNGAETGGVEGRSAVGSYSANSDGHVANGSEDAGGRMRSVGNDLRDMADSAGRAVRDIM